MSYVDGFVAPVKLEKKQAYIDMASMASGIFKEYGAIRVVETWSDDVPHGKQTDFYRSVAAEEGEAIVFSWIEWPSKEVRDAGMAKVMEDDRFKGEMPFDGKRMIYGGYTTIVDTGA